MNEEEIRADEREKIAKELEAWHSFWNQPQRVSFTNQTVPASKTISKDWLLEFAKKLRKDGLKAPTGPQDPLFKS